MRNLVVSGYYGSKNAGDEAMLAAMLEVLSDLDPKLHITVISADPEDTRERHGVDAVGWLDITAILQLLGHADLLLAGASREQSCLVDDVGKVGADKSRRALGKDGKVDIRRKLFILGMDFEDRFAAVHVGAVNSDMTVETARPEQRRIENVGSVCGRDQDDARLFVKAVHLNEQLIERLLALVV